MVHAWNLPAWDALFGDPEKLPHAVLLAGPPGVGKRDFGLSLAARLLCRSARNNQQACGDCDGCRLIAAGNHPDLVLVAPESESAGESGDSSSNTGATRTAEVNRKPSRQIRIEQIRACGERVEVGSHQGGHRVFVIQPAEAMNVPTANSLLKLLEEPPTNTSFILVSSEPSRLLATVLSRCRRIALRAPEATAALAWLQLGGVAEPAALLAYCSGNPLLAKLLADSPHMLAAQRAVIGQLSQGHALDATAAASDIEALLKLREPGLPSFGMEELVDCVQKWIVDLVRLTAGISVRYFVAESEQMVDIAERSVRAALLDCYNYLVKLRRHAEHPLNSRLFVEDLLIRYVRAVAPAEAS